MSEDPLSISALEMVAVPSGPSSTVMFWQIAVGAKVSSTSTSAVQEFVFPLLSVTVSVTIFSPTLEQSKLVVSILAVSTAQLSVLPPSIIAAVIFATPEEFRATVMF